MTPEIFLSYKREDERYAARLAKALEAEGLAVWWDRSLIPAESWREQIQSALDAAKCVVVIWTRESAGPQGDFVRDEAGQAKGRGVLVPVMMEKTRLPIGFGEMQAVDLIGWRGSRSNIFFKDLVAACRAKIDGERPPKPRGPLRRALSRATAGGGMLAGVMAVAAFVGNVGSVQNQVCSVRVVQPGLSDTCGAMGLGDKPTREEREAFAALAPGDCDALSEFARRYETSPLRALADSRLADVRIRTEESWVTSERQDPRLTQPAFADPEPTEAAARAATLSLAQTQAEDLCRGFAASVTFRFNGASPRDLDWRCEQDSSGHVCSASGFAECDLEELRVVEHRTCGGD